MRFQIGTSPAERFDALRARRAKPPVPASHAIQTVDGLGAYTCPPWHVATYDQGKMFCKPVRNRMLRGLGHAPCGSCAGRGVARPLGGLGDAASDAKVQASLAAVRDGLIVAGALLVGGALLYSFVGKK